MAILRYRKKTAEVDALCFDGHNFGELVDWGVEGSFDIDDGLSIWVIKSSAYCHVWIGDFVVREQDGVGWYPCCAEQFHLTYDQVNGEIIEQPRQS